MIYAKKSRYIYIVFIIISSSLIGLYYNPKQNLVGSKVVVLKKPFTPPFFITDTDYKSPFSKENTNFRVRSSGYDLFQKGYHRVGFNFEALKLEPTDMGVSIGRNNQEHLSFVLSDDFIILQQNQKIKIFKKEDSQLYWELDVLASKKNKILTFLDYVVVPTGEGELYFFDLNRKKMIFNVKLGESFYGGAYFDERYLYISVKEKPSKNYIAKINISDLSVVWVSDYLEMTSLSSPFVSEEALYVYDNKGNIKAFDKMTGKKIWNQKLEEPIAGELIAHKDHLVFATKNNRVMTLDTETGEIRWSHQADKSFLSSFAVHKYLNEVVFSAEDGIYKLDLKDGKRISFLNFPLGNQSQHSYPLLVENNEGIFILLNCSKERVCMLKYKGLQLLQFFKVNEDLKSQIKVDSNKFFILSQKKKQLLTLQ